jgi:hypothetical protein
MMIMVGNYLYEVLYSSFYDFVFISVMQSRIIRVGRFVNGEVARIWKKAIVTSLWYCPHFGWRDWGTLWKTSGGTTSVPAKIRTWYLPNTSLERCR